jgi:hypothetical protein
LNCGEFNNSKVCGHTFTGCDVCDTCCKSWLKPVDSCNACVKDECASGRHPDCCVSFECVNGQCQRAYLATGVYPNMTACEKACGTSGPTSCAAPLEGTAVQGLILKTLEGVSNLGVCCDECRICTNCTAVTINGTVCTLRSMTGATQSANVTSGVTTCIPPQKDYDPGWGSDYSGYYDVQGCGKCNDFCRWVGDSGPGGDPRSELTYGDAPYTSFWACVINAGYTTAWGTWKKNIAATWTFSKC